MASVDASSMAWQAPCARYCSIGCAASPVRAKPSLHPVADRSRSNIGQRRWRPAWLCRSAPGRSTWRTRPRAHRGRPSLPLRADTPVRRRPRPGSASRPGAADTARNGSRARSRRRRPRGELAEVSCLGQGNGPAVSDITGADRLVIAEVGAQCGPQAVRGQHQRAAVRLGVRDRRRRLGPGLYPEDLRVGDQIDASALAGTVEDVKQVTAVDDDVGASYLLRKSRPRSR